MLANYYCVNFTHSATIMNNEQSLAFLCISCSFIQSIFSSNLLYVFVIVSDGSFFQFRCLMGLFSPGFTCSFLLLHIFLLHFFCIYSSILFLNFELHAAH